MPTSSTPQRLPPRRFPGFVQHHHPAASSAPPPPAYGAPPASPAYGYAPVSFTYSTAPLVPPTYANAPPPPPAYGSASPRPTPTPSGPSGAPPRPPPRPTTYASTAQGGAAVAFIPGPHFPPMPAVAESSAQARVRNSLLNLSLGLLTQVSPLPLHDPSSVFEFVEMNNNLRRCIRAIREIAGDHDPDHWHRSWITPLQRQIHTAVRNVPGTLRSPV